jgi:hypothetical protein
MFPTNTHHLFVTHETDIIAKLILLPTQPLTFRNLAPYIKDGRTATLQMLHFIYIYIFNKYKYLVF